MHATCPVHLILLDFIILIICGEIADHEVLHYASFLERGRGKLVYYEKERTLDFGIKCVDNACNT
jgi:hypothetical protein